MSTIQKMRLELMAALLFVAGVAPGADPVVNGIDPTGYYNRIQSDGNPLTVTPVNGPGTPTAGQFGSVVILGASSPHTHESAAAAPTGVGYKLGRTWVGAPTFSRVSTFRFGEVIPPPSVEIDGVSPVDGLAYWEPRPFVASDRLDYAWDAARNRVFAVRDIPANGVDIVWQVSTPEDEPSTSFVEGELTGTAGSRQGYTSISGARYRLREHRNPSLITKGSTITPPTLDVDGKSVSGDGWVARPYGLRETERYYYSPSSGLVYATQPGPVSVTWRTRNPLPAGHGRPADEFISDAGSDYGLSRIDLVISGVAAQPPRTIFWTGQGQAGVPVTVPNERIDQVKIVYNSDFPEQVAPGQGMKLGGSVGAREGGVEVVNTLWYNSTVRALSALNREGRVFMELLGAPHAVTGLPEHLGIEIVDVARRARPVDATAIVGEALPVQTRAVDGAALVPELADILGGSDFVFQHFPSGTRIPTFYATRETRNVNDLSLWWKEEGLQGILWPARKVRYAVTWPTDEAAYSHYVRPNAPRHVAQNTAIALPTANAPTIVFQDEPVRAALTPDFKFFSWLDDSYPAHRTLMQFTSGDYVRFERIFSWLDNEVKLNAPASGGYQVNVIENNVTPGFSKLDSPRDIAVVGDKLYVVARNSETFTQIDISNPAAPVWKFEAHFPFGDGTFGTTRAVAANADRAFVASYYHDYVRVFNVTGEIPSIHRTIQDGASPLDKLNGPLGLDVSADGRYLYIATPADDSLTVYDLENAPTAWRLANATSLNGASSVAVKNGYAYIANTDGGSLAIVNVNDPASGLPVVGTPHGGLDKPQHVTVAAVGEETVAFVSEDSSTVRIIQVPTLTSSGAPLELAVIDETTDLGPTPRPRGTAFSGGLLYITYFSGDAVSVWDVSIPRDPKRIGLIRKSDSQFDKLDGPISIAVENERAFVACSSSDTIVSFDVSHLNHFKTHGISLSQGSVAAHLSGFDSDYGIIRWPDPTQAPRVVEGEALVGSRISAPFGEIGGDGSIHVAGHINYLAAADSTDGRPRSASFSATAYIDPLEKSFEEANSGAIIPVNAIPGDDNLEVWWFRTNNVNTVQGFDPIYWPSVIGRYTLRYPTPADTQSYNRIVLASNDGTGPLASLPAKGSIYYENEPTELGYNPNEEHALMIGGQGYALRDDLNHYADKIPDGQSYSSDPYVLLEYTEFDGRPAMSAYEVMRTEPGTKFEFTVEAGKILQPPMPLPLMAKPEVYDPDAQAPISLDEEASDPVGVSSVTFTTEVVSGIPFDVTKAEVTMRDWPNVSAGSAGYLHSPDGADTISISVAGVDQRHRKVAGYIGYFQHVRVAPVGNQTYTVAEFGTYLRVDGILHAVPQDRYEYLVPKDVIDSSGIGVGMSVMVRGVDENEDPMLVGAKVIAAYSPNFSAVVEGDFSPSVIFPDDNGHYRILLEFADPVEDTLKVGNKVSLQLIQAIDSSELDFTDWRSTLDPKPPSDTPVQPDSVRHSEYTFKDRKNSIWVYRGPATGDEGEFKMRYYYKTLRGFHFPSLEDQPPFGTISPYLTSDGEEERVYGNRNDNPNKGDGNALQISYYAEWPSDPPILHMAETLTLPKRGLPAMRGQTSLQILIDESAAKSSGKPSVVLHDSTREKVYEMGTTVGSEALDQVPVSIKTQLYQGKTYFPNLPPHLADRIFFDPTRGAKGSLVFRGEFVDAPTGEDYVLLNVLSAQDKAVLTSDDFLSPGDPDKAPWDAVINSGLTTTMELFVPSRTQPGTFTASETRSTSIGPDQLAAIDNDDVAVDSYALTATGPGTGYVTLVSGNGRAFTPTDEPVSLHIIKVSDVLHRGEVKPVPSSNPFSEKVSFQQVVDLAGKIDNYEFDWRIAAPVDGAPPGVYQRTAANIFPSGQSWNHLPLVRESGDRGLSLSGAPSRFENTVPGRVTAVSEIPFLAVQGVPDADPKNGIDPKKLKFTVSAPHRVSGDQPAVLDMVEGVVSGTLTPIANSTTELMFVLAEDEAATFVAPFDASRIIRLSEAINAELPQSVVSKEFTIPEGDYSEIWLSLDLGIGTNLGAVVSLGETRLVTANRGSGDTETATPAADIAALNKAYRLSADDFGPGEYRLAIELYSSALPGTEQTFDLRIDAYEAVDLADSGTQWIQQLTPNDGTRAVLGGTADIRTLSDNYVIMRYRAKEESHASYVDGGGWSLWTEPQLAEGWIKRVLAGINPFNQRVTDLFANRVDSDVSIITQAGQRWEGNVALNLESINDFGLIEIYETVLNRGKDLSIDAGINYGPANDALLLAAGYINDLYMMVGNEAFADAANPTIGIGTADQTYGDIATSLFSFKGQLPTLLEEELALLRGRDDFIQPGVETAPAYNRLFWNYTRGIDSGEVIYALNYNIQEDNDDGVDGKIDADDARKMFPQGHGDAYGHYLTATKSYYKLIMDEDFTWVPRTEAVTILGKPVQVDYLDERKFAAAAAKVAETGKQVFDLTWRKDYRTGGDNGWEHFATNRVNSSRQQTTTRYWGMDHWANRTHQGAYFNWVAGNSMLPEVDGDPSHEGIQKIDRTTVPELKQLVAIARDLQASLDNAEAHMNPLGLPEDAVPFDINPSVVTSGDSSTHFEQIYERALRALNNATVAFDDAKDVTRLMRSEEDSLSDFQTGIAREELAFRHQLIELYGTPYSDDIGPGKTYAQGYEGPDLFHYTYVDNVELTIPGWLEPKTDYTGENAFQIDNQENPFSVSFDTLIDDNDLVDTPSNITNVIKLALDFEDDRTAAETVEVGFNSHGFFDRPSSWTGRRKSPGRMQTAISEVILAVNALHDSIEDYNALKGQLDREIEIFREEHAAKNYLREANRANLALATIFENVLVGHELYEKAQENIINFAEKAKVATTKGIPRNVVFGLANGGDLTAPVRAALEASGLVAETGFKTAEFAEFAVFKAVEVVNTERDRWFEFGLQPVELTEEVRAHLQTFDSTLGDAQIAIFALNEKLQRLDQAWRDYYALQAEGDRIQAEREVFRQRAAAVVQGFRTRDAGFRLFRNEKLERYKTLFDLAGKYAFLSAKAYDYETGLLDTPAGREFIERIINSRALGVVQDGEPHFAGSNTGDPGLSSALAEMKADWDVLKGRLGFNNSDGQGTTVSLRMEKHRISGNADFDANWRDILESGRRANLLEDSDIRRFAMQIDEGDGLPVPGIVIEFPTSIEKGYNLFGRPLLGGDHSFSTAHFATKIFAVGVALEGYQGMDDPAANNAATGGTGAPDPSTFFLDDLALAANPEIFLIPAGQDWMRSPPLGDSGKLRAWNIQDVTIPLPFNIGASDFSTKKLWQSADSLTDELFGLRKHPPFRPVSSESVFASEVYGSDGLSVSQYTSSRLIGRSVWNTNWKLVIPGYALLNDPEEGLDRFIQTVKDIKLHFVTYSYSGN